jgi:hypothetical protein
MSQDSQRPRPRHNHQAAQVIGRIFAVHEQVEEQQEPEETALQRLLVSVPPSSAAAEDARGTESAEGADGEDDRDKIKGLELALEHRTVLGQATGIVMERYGLSAEQAWEKLARASQHTNRKVYLLASELVVNGSTEGL